MDLDRLTLTALAETGLARIRQEEKRQAEAARQAAAHEEAVKAAIVAGCKALLPKALVDYITFGETHHYQAREDWDCTCLIQVPEWAPIKVRLEVSEPGLPGNRFEDHNPAKLAVTLWNTRRGAEWFEVLSSFTVRYDPDIEEGYYIVNDHSRTYDDITLALAEARKAGDPRPALHETARQILGISQAAIVAEELPKTSGVAENIAQLQKEFPEANTTEKLLAITSAALINIAEAMETIAERL